MHPGGIFTLPPQEAVALFVAYAPPPGPRPSAAAGAGGGEGAVRLKDEDEGQLRIRFSTGQQQEVRRARLTWIAPAFFFFSS